MLSYVSLSESFSHQPLNPSSDFTSVWSRIWSSLSIRTSSGFACKGFGDDEIKPKYSGELNNWETNANILCTYLSYYN